MIYSILIVSILYIIVALGYMQVMPQLDGQLDLKPIDTRWEQLAAENLVGNPSWDCYFYDGSHGQCWGFSSFKISVRQGGGADNLLPSFLGKLSQKSLTPVTSIFVSCIIIVASMYALNVEALVQNYVSLHDHYVCSCEYNCNRTERKSSNGISRALKQNFTQDCRVLVLSLVWFTFLN